MQISLVLGSLNLLHLSYYNMHTTGLQYRPNSIFIYVKVGQQCKLREYNTTAYAEVVSKWKIAPRNKGTPCAKLLTGLVMWLSTMHSLGTHNTRMCNQFLLKYYCILQLLSTRFLFEVCVEFKAKGFLLLLGVTQFIWCINRNIP